VPVGAPCNTCARNPDRYAVIRRLRPDGTHLETFARGVRNTVGFDWHPTTKELWFTDNGRDWLGDDSPPDELNHAPRPGMHFGFPYCHGERIPDPEFGSKRQCTEFTPPVRNLDPHVAALGMRFYTGTMFPEAYRQHIFIAEHGSWNRSTPIGYRVTLVRLDNNRAVSYEPFAEGWLGDGRAWGRPVDVPVMPDGSLLVSDDHAGVIYRITYKE
jgi:glucose/arabinose dehydrogenase